MLKIEGRLRETKIFLRMALLTSPFFLPLLKFISYADLVSVTHLKLLNQASVPLNISIKKLTNQMTAFRYLRKKSKISGKSQFEIFYETEGR